MIADKGHTNWPLVVGGSIVALLLLVAVCLGALWVGARLGQTRDRALQVSCEANLRQLGLGQQMYCQDYGSRFAPAGHWCDAIYPYVLNANVYVCPGAPGRPCGYSLNSAVDRLDLAKVQTPAGLVAAFDGGGSWNSVGGVGQVDYRHLDGANVLFADSHVRALDPQAFGSIWKGGGGP